MDASQIINLITPIFAPLIVALVKVISPRLPGWTLPIICTVAGAAGNVVLHYAATEPQNVALAVVLAMAGVAVREVKDQLTPHTVESAIADVKSAEADLKVAQAKENNN